MHREAVLERILEIGIVPVIRADSVEDACRVVDALYDNGIAIVEVTMTVPDAPAVMQRVSQKYGSKLLLGAGTVLNAEQAQRCVDMGASFLVSPGLSLAVLHYAKSEDLLAIPGVLTPTEVMAALAEGVEVMKLFPCGSVGGAAYLKAMRGPFPNVSFIPTGGVSASNAAQYFAAGAVAIGVGGELVSAAALRSGDLTPIHQAAQALLREVRSGRPGLSR